MAGDAGTLEVKMVMGLARLQQDVTQAKDIVGRGMAGIESAARVASVALGALGATLSVGFFANLVKGSIDAMDHLNDLSKSTSLAVETLAGLKLAARQTGSDLDGTAAAINKLSVNIGNNTEKFAKLGITAKDPLEAFKQLADVTNAILDPQQRAAVLAEALGKSWQQAAPLLAEGGKKIGEMVEKGEKLSGITTEMAHAADELNDKWAELTGNGGLLNSVVGASLPLMNKLAQDLLDVREKGEGASTFAEHFRNVLGFLVTQVGEVVFVLKGMGLELGGIAAQGAALLSVQFQLMTGNVGGAIKEFQRFGDISDQMKADADANRKAHEEWKSSIAAVGVTAGMAAKSVKGMSEEDLEAARIASDAAKAFLAKTEALKKSTKATDEAREAAKRARLEWDDELESLKDQLKAFKDQHDALEKMEKLFEKNAEHFQHAAAVEMAEAAGEMVESGMKVHDQWLATWTQIGDAAGDFFADLVTNGRNAFDNLKKYVKDLLAQMIALFAKRWILNMAAGGSFAGAAGDAAGSMLGGGGGNGVGGALLSAGSAYLFGTSATAVGAGAGAGVFAGSVATGTVGTAGLVGTGGAMASVYTALAAIPVWGWIAMAVIAAVAFFSGRGGGPKVEGSSVGSFDAAGNPLGAYRVSDEYGNRFLRGTAMDSALDPLRTSTGNTYRNLVGLLGGSFTSAGFGFGASNDPAGDARSRVFGSAMVNGRNVFDGIMDVDDKEVDAALMLTSKRAILAALQATDFDDEIDKIFAGAGDVAKLTGEQIDALIAQAREMYGVIQGIKGLGLTGLDVEALRQFALEGESIGQTFNRVAGAWMQLQESFTSDEVKVQNAHAALSGLFEDLRTAGVDLPTTRDGWLDVMRGLDLSTEAGRALFTQMMNLAPAFDAVATASQAALDEFDQLMGRLRPGYSAGLGQASLSSSLGQFIAGNAWTAGMSPQAVLEALRTITREDFQAYLAHDPTMGRLINTILTLDDTLNGTNTVLTAIAAAGPSGSTIFGGDLSNPNVRPGPTWEWNGSTWVNTATGGGGAGGGGLDEYLKSLLLGSSSTLDPQERLAEAKKQFEDALGGGDSGAIRSAHQAYIDIAQQLFGSTSAFVDIFKTTFDQIAGVGGLDDLNTRLLDIQTRQHQVQLDSYGVLLQIRDDGRRTTEVLAAIVERATNAAPAEAERR